MDFLFYLVQVNLYLILFYSFYRLVLFGETFHHLNRMYLVVSALLSFGIPLWYSEYVQSWFITKEINAVFFNLYDPSMALIRPTAGVSFTWSDMFEGVYIVGISIFTVRLFITLLQLLLVLKNKNFEKFSAFSFFGYSFVDETLKKRETILAHEHVHMQQLHSADVIIFEVIAILNWFNPVVYQYKRDIKHIHEFIADEIASANEKTKADYAMLLFTQEFGLQPHQLINRFFTHSTLKRRIQMLNKPRSHRIMLLKYGLSVPLFVLMLVLSSAMIVENKVFDSVGSGINRIAGNEVNFKAVDQLQIAEAEKRALASDKIIIGRVVSAEDNKPLPSVTVTIVDKEGSTKTDANGVYEINADEADKLRFSFTGFEPVIVPVNEKTIIDVALHEIKARPIALEEVTVLQLNKKPEGYDDEVYDIVEEHPEFPGGVKELFSFVSQNIRYPADAEKNNISGKVFARFVVGRDGSISNVRILKGVGYGCDEETVRVLSTMPRWQPGKKNGIPVAVHYTMPVNFVMQEKEVTSLQIPDNDPAFRLRIRGVSAKSGLIILDGKEVKNDALAKIEARSVESVYVLKDQLAVNSYGERAREGVVIINTKALAENRK